MSELQAERLMLAYREVPVIADLDLLLPARPITALVGPNGCGKSTLLRALARLLRPRAGAVYLDGASISQLPAKELARQLGLLPQAPVAPEGIIVRELVAQGRYPHQRWLRQWSTEDARASERALEIAGMADLADRQVDELSGGQRQRAWIAMTLAQDTEILLLDEATTFLDMAHQMEVLQLLERLNREQGRTVVMVVHDLNHASRHAHHIVAMSQGKVFTAGPPEVVVAPTVLREVFGVEARVLPDPETGRSLCIPFGLRCDAASPTEPTAALPPDKYSAVEQGEHAYP